MHPSARQSSTTPSIWWRHRSPHTRRFCIGLLLAVLVASPSLPSCSSKKSTDTEQDENCDPEQWDFDTGGYYAYTHDCNPYYGEHFTIYSDGSSTEAKQTLAILAEEAFDELIPGFLIQDIEAELKFTGDYTYYIFAQKYIEDPKAMGYRNGFFISAVDCASVPSVHDRHPNLYRYLIRHELTHVFQFTLTDCPRNSACPGWLGVWFREGQAIIMGGNYGGMSIDSLTEFQTWVSDSNHINPIQIHRWENFPDPDHSGSYYPMFGLAYAYLVDGENGHGATIGDMRHMFSLMADGDDFFAAFETALGMSVSYYEEHFYNLMETYLGTQK